MTTTKTRIDAPAGDYVLTNGSSSISFKTRHMYGLGPVKGHLSVRSGNLHVVDGIAGSAVNAVVEASSFTTHNPIRDLHSPGPKTKQSGLHQTRGRLTAATRTP